MKPDSVDGSHVIISDIAAFGERRKNSILEARIEDFTSSYVFRADKSYSCIITTQTRNCESVTKFLDKYGFKEIGSSIGHHRNRLYYYFKPKGI